MGIGLPLNSPEKPRTSRATQNLPYFGRYTGNPGESLGSCRDPWGAVGGPGQDTQSFATTTKGLLALAGWMQDHQVTHVAMESTGVYWKPIHNLLEADFTLLVVNARHIKAVPGRKTDIKDAEWIADLLRHGLLWGSYIPDRSVLLWS